MKTKWRANSTHPDDMSRYREWLKVRNCRWPISITIHLTNRCNHDCKFCWFDRNDSRVDVQKTIAAISFLIDRGLQEVIVSGGGEPTLHPELELLLEFLADRSDIHRRLYSNGTKLGKLTTICKAFDYVRVSVDAFNPESHSTIHGTSRTAFGQIIDALRDLSSSNVTVGLSCVLIPESDQGLSDLAELSEMNPNFFSCSKKG
ncbi:MAG: radical SAM protein [Planctomycetota bacterium]|nr:MAG: radical SAM protein [Planctomycetota bacterium]